MSGQAVLLGLPHQQVLAGYEFIHATTLKDSVDKGQDQPDGALRRNIMKKADIKVYKQRLLEMRRRLRGDVTAMADVALGSESSEPTSMPIHMAELGSDNFEQEFTLSLLATEEGTLGMIEDALVRIENGSFATCTECEGKIPKTRLNAIPYTPLCFQCAENGEHKSRGRETDGGAANKRATNGRRVNRPR